MINVYLSPINYSSSNFEEELEKLPSLVQLRILKKKQKRKQIASLLAYRLLQQALEEQYQLSLETISFSEAGKPSLTNSSIHFNISHSKTLIGVALSNQGAVGLDIESFREFDPIEAAFLFFSKVEQEAILAAKQPNERLIEYWSKKEALIKLLGKQMFDIAAQTDVRFLSTYWQGKKFFFHALPSKLEHQIWLSSSFSIDDVFVKELIP